MLGESSVKDLENRIVREVQGSCTQNETLGRRIGLGESLGILVKLERAHGGYLGTQRRRRTWLPTIRFGELEAGTDPKISEWGNPETAT